MRHAVTALALLAGCVDVTRPVSRRARPAVDRARADLAAAEAHRRAALPRVPAAQRVTFRSFESEGEVAHDAMGPLRFDRRGMALTPAEDVPAHPIVFARKAARGWVFVTERDEVYVSPTFTGRLRAVRTPGCAAPPPPAPADPRTHPEQAAAAAADEAFARWRHERRERRPDASPVLWRSSGRVAFSLRGRAFWSDGASLHEVAEPGVVALAWRGEALGARILGHRALELTRDGGRSWRPVPLGDAAPARPGRHQRLARRRDLAGRAPPARRRVHRPGGAADFARPLVSVRRRGRPDRCCAGPLRARLRARRGRPARVCPPGAPSPRGSRPASSPTCRATAGRTRCPRGASPGAAWRRSAPRGAGRSSTPAPSPRC
jgi:hypothetical protein